MSGMALRRVLLTLLVLCMAVYWLLNVFRQNYLNRLVSPDNVFEYASRFSDGGTVIHYTVRNYKRTMSALSEPPDPYHRAALPFYKKDRIVETWVSTDSFHEIERLDDVGRTVVGERLRTPEEFAAYNALSNLAVRFAWTNSEVASDSESQAVASISKVAQSAWGTKAVRIRFDPQIIDKAVYDIQNIRLVEQGPYASDLQFSHVQTIWEVDAETELPISKKVVALTNSGEIVLNSEIRTKPDLVRMDTLAFEWGDFITEEAKASYRLIKELPKSMEEAVARKQEEQSGKLDSPRASPVEILALVEHKIYIFDTDDLDGSDLQLSFEGISAPHQGQCYQDRLAYSLATCHDVLVIVEYVSRSRNDWGVIITVGLSEDVVPRLKQALPTWTSSERRTLHVAGSELDAWLLSYAMTEGRHSVVFERDELFVQVDGYGMPPNVLLKLMSYLKVLEYEKESGGVRLGKT